MADCRWVQVDWTIGSDVRIKNNVTEDVKGIEFIKELRPVTYYYDLDKENALLGVIDSLDYKGKYDIEKIKFSGFIAQEVEAAAKKTGYDFSGVDKGGKIWGLRYSEFVVPLVKSVQELNTKNEEQQVVIESQKNEIDDLKARIEKLESMIK